jgi:hypothetical protein
MGLLTLELYISAGCAKGVRTSDPLLAEPKIYFRLPPENVLESFINDKKNTKCLTNNEEEWFKDTVGRILRLLPVPLPQANRQHIVTFLGSYNSKPGSNHPFFPATKHL